MSRYELLAFIRNAVLMGDTLNIYDLGDIYSYLDLDSLDFEILKNSFNGSVEFNRMYFKERDGKIILTFCAANYKYLDLGDTVDIIGPLAFASNSSLVELKSETVTVIERQAFTECSIKYAEFSALKRIEFAAFFKSKIEKIVAPALETILISGFCCCAHLKEVDAKNVKDIKSNAFGRCTNLKSVSFRCVKHIENGAFYECTSLKFSIRNLTYKYSKLLECRNKILSLLKIA